MYIKDGHSKVVEGYGGGLSDQGSATEIAEIVYRSDPDRDNVEDIMSIVRGKHKDGLMYSSSFYFTEKRYMWGWLGYSVIKSGWEDEDEKKLVIQALKGLDSNFRLDHYCGIHECEVCEHETCKKCHNRPCKKDCRAYNGSTSFNGSIYIKHNGTIYCCHNGVEHYIEEHDYCPSKEVIEAIVNGKFLNSLDFAECYYSKNKSKIKKVFNDLKKKEADRMKVKIGHERRMKRIDEKRTPEQRSVLKRLKEGALDLVGLNK